MFTINAMISHITLWLQSMTISDGATCVILVTWESIQDDGVKSNVGMEIGCGCVDGKLWCKGEAKRGCNGQKHESGESEQISVWN